jgi:adenylate cyclase
MSQLSCELPSRLSKINAILVHTDISRFLQIASEIDDSAGTINFLDGYYTLCSRHFNSHGGEVIKYMGDGCLAMFKDSNCEAALEAICAIRDAFPTYCTECGIAPTDIRGGLHAGDVITGEFGPEGYKDVLGRTSNVLFQLSGPGITITEQVYRKLPSDKRSPWKKEGGHVVYVMK